MTIYILDKDPDKCANMLDDKSLDKMIKDIAQVLCNVHHVDTPCMMKSWRKDIPLKPKWPTKFGSALLDDKWTVWAREYKANYLYMVELAEICSRELNIRFEGLTQKQIDLEKILIWARDNVPDLPEMYVRDYSRPITTNQGLWPGGVQTPVKKDSAYVPTLFPLVMPKKYLWPERAKDDKRLYGFSEIELITRQYKHYYKANLDKQKNKNTIWTKRVKPDFLII